MRYVYFLRSRRNPAKVYTGKTNDLERRLEEHNAGEGGRYTNQFKPWRIEAYVLTDTEQTATTVEEYFKTPSGTEKFDRFATSNPLHPNPKQGFFDSLTEGRAFGRGENRFITVKERGQTVFKMNRQEEGERI
jgi:putative endonuclease